jgi:hypothetical protein
MREQRFSIERYAHIRLTGQRFVMLLKRLIALCAEEMTAYCLQRLVPGQSHMCESSISFFSPPQSNLHVEVIVSHGLSAALNLPAPSLRQ